MSAAGSSVTASMLPYPAMIVAIRDESEDTRTFVLRLRAPVPALDAAGPGQFVMLSLLGYGEAAFTLASLVSAGAEPGTVTLTVRRVGSLTWALFASSANIASRVASDNPHRTPRKRPIASSTYD